MEQRNQSLSYDNLQESLDAATNATQYGHQQFLTPPEIAKQLAVPLTKHRDTIIDLQCANGNLLSQAATFTTRNFLGIDIDPRSKIENIPQDALPQVIHGDCTSAFQLLDEVGFEADCFVLNPPFSLNWHTEKLNVLSNSSCPAVAETFARYSNKETIDSTLATFLMALHLCTIRGEGYMICNESTAKRFFGDLEEGTMTALTKHLWAWLSLPNFFPNVKQDMRIAVLYFGKDVNQKSPLYKSLESINDLEEAVRDMGIERRDYFNGMHVTAEYYCNRETVDKFRAVREEFLTRKKGTDRSYNIWLDSSSGRIRRNLDPFQKISGKVPVELVMKLNELEGQLPISLVVQKATRTALLNVVHSNVWRVEPKLIETVTKAVDDYNAIRAPFYPLNAVQRLGYLDEEDSIVCKKEGFFNFKKGESYPIFSKTVHSTKKAKKKNLTGGEDDVEISGKELLISIENAGGFQHFTSSPKDIEGGGENKANLHDLQTLIEYFVIPEVKTVSEVNPEKYEQNINRIKEIESTLNGFKYRQYQIEDNARAAMHDGAILGWEQGLGKTSAALTWPQIKGAKRTLIVAPGSLHKQIIDEAETKFNIHVTSLENQKTFYDLGLDAKPLPMGKPEFYITTYQALGMNGGDERCPKLDAKGKPLTNKTIERRRMAHPGVIEYIQRFLVAVKASNPNRSQLPKNIQEKIAKLEALANCPSAKEGEVRNALEIISRLAGEANATPEKDTITFELPKGFNTEFLFDGVGSEQTYENGHTIRCLFTPTLSTLSADKFDCVVIDEGVRLKANDSFVSLGVRAMRPQYRLVLTGTPIKNLLDDLFWLAHWAAGGYEDATPRWPYENSNAAKERFANEHMLAERNISAEEARYAETGRYVKSIKRTANICNIHRLWKLLGPVLIRRRKDNCGEEIVSKTFIPVKVKPGKAQHLVYQTYLQNQPAYTNSHPRKPIDDPPTKIAVQLQLLRQAALCPDSPSLSKSILNVDAKGVERSWTDMNPKAAAIFSIIIDKLSIGEQVVVMSPFRHFSQQIKQRLDEAGVKACLLDGGTNQMKRGIEASKFKKMEYSVLIGGMESMSEGHSFECCPNIILPSLGWALDKNSQAIDRVHRMNSKKPVSVFILCTKNTIDERLEAIYSDKGDASQLAIDGQLTDIEMEEINLADLLENSIKDFDENTPTTDELKIEEEWDSTRAKLRNAEGTFREFHPPIVTPATLTAPKVTIKDVEVECKLLEDFMNDLEEATTPEVPQPEDKEPEVEAPTPELSPEEQRIKAAFDLLDSLM